MSLEKTTKLRKKDWYTVSVETLRGWGVFLVVLVVGAGGFLYYRHWERTALVREARAVVAEAGTLAEQLRDAAGAVTFGEELAEGRASLEEARRYLEAEEYTPARDKGRRSRALFQAILDAMRDRAQGGEAQFIAVQGGVEFRRGDRGDWEAARSRLVLRSGDYVKTSGNGSAEIVFLDGTLYTVRPNTLFLVTRTRTGSGEPGEQSIAMEYGWVNLNTSQRGSRISTPKAEARVARQSEAMVTYDQKTAVGRFTAFRGEISVASNAGVERRLGALEQLTQSGDQLTATLALPSGPELIVPNDKSELVLDTTKTLLLRWEPTPKAARYALQVARSRLFVDNIIDVDARSKTSATLGLRAPGTFLWRVAAISRDGLQGPWSTQRTFRVVSVRSGGGEGDRVPPPLDIEEVQPYGSIVIIGGHTEPGAAVVINGEQVAVGADGSFTKTVQLAKEGWSFVEIRSRDASGNETSARRRVFVESL